MYILSRLLTRIQFIHVGKYIMAFAVIGDSFISRLEDYVRKEKHPARQYAFFGTLGMSTNKKFEQAFQRMKHFNPRYVLLNVGGNDLRSDSDIYGVFTDIVRCVDRILNECEDVRGIWVCSIVERGKFPSWNGLTRTSFNRMRRELNKLLKEHFEEFFVDIQKSLKYPKHYENDLVHPRYGIGMKLLADIVVRYFRPYS